jgi:hypothetical protein
MKQTGTKPIRTDSVLVKYTGNFEFIHWLLFEVGFQFLACKVLYDVQYPPYIEAGTSNSRQNANLNLLGHVPSYRRRREIFKQREIDSIHLRSARFCRQSHHSQR